MNETKMKLMEELNLLKKLENFEQNCSMQTESNLFIYMLIGFDENKKVELKINNYKQAKLFANKFMSMVLEQIDELDKSISVKLKG